MRCSPTAFMCAPSARFRHPASSSIAPSSPPALPCLSSRAAAMPRKADRGGREIARYFADHGIISFVLRYRLPGEGWKNREMVPLQDAQRAVRLIRAGEYGAGRLGVIGFSAGGHLSATLAIRSGMATYDALTPADRGSARPDIAAHMYPVITMGEGAHQGSRDKLLGPSPTPQAVADWSLEQHVGSDTVPSYICLAADDDIVPPQPT